MRRRRVGALTFAAAVILVMLGTIACDPGRVVELVNATGQDVTIVIDGVDQGVLADGQEVGFSTLEGARFGRLQVFDVGGLLFLDEELSWDDVSALDFRIVIE